MNQVTFVNLTLSILTVAGQIIVVIGIPLLAAKRGQSLMRWVAKNGFGLAFVVALVATLGSLFYSEIALYEPCKLCWLQRIFMYPLVLALGISLYKGTSEARDYVLASSVIGALIALYHVYLQHSPNPLAPCSTIGYSVSCTEKFVQTFGYITIPMMALTAFVMIIFLLTAHKVYAQK